MKSLGWTKLDQHCMVLLLHCLPPSHPPQLVLINSVRVFLSFSLPCLTNVRRLKVSALGLVSQTGTMLRATLAAERFTVIESTWVQTIQTTSPTNTSTVLDQGTGE